MVIKDIKIRKLSSNYGDGKVFGQPKGKKSLVIIQIFTECGLVGIGETYSSVYSPNLVEIILNIFKKKIISKKFSLNNLFYNELNLPFIGQTGIFKSVKSAIEIALFDIVSQKKQEPLYKTLNALSKNKSIEVYASGGSVIFNESQIAAEIEEIQKKEFKNYKMRIGFQNIENDFHRVKASRNQLGSNGLMLDAIMGTLIKKWKIEDCLNMIEMLKEFNPIWLEEPLDPQEILAYSDLNKLSKIDIAFGESFTSFNEFLCALNNNCSKYIQPDATHCGYLDLIKLLNHVEDYKNVKIALHVWGSPISLLANMHFAIAFNKISFLEIPMVKLDFLNHKIKSIYEIKNGLLKYNDAKNGLGIEIEEGDLNKLDFVENSGFEI